MRKFVTITITAAVILAVVLCTAGCISPADEIVGNWLEKTDGAVTSAVFAEDGTGVFSKDGAGFFAGSADADSVLTLEWKANGDTTYTFIFADGTTKTGTLNALRGLMTMSDGCVLEKQASEMSGVTATVLNMPPGQQVVGQDSKMHTQKRGFYVYTKE